MALTSIPAIVAIDTVAGAANLTLAPTTVSTIVSFDILIP
jgi:hypothetical protein